MSADSVDTDTEILDGALAPVVVSDSQRRRGMLFLGFAVGFAMVAMAVQLGLNANFLREDIGVSGFEMGMLESSRETCGIVAFALLALLAGLAEPLVGALMLIVLALGLGTYYWATDFWAILFLGLIWSQGLHIWMPLPNSMAMAMAEPGRTGYRVGQIQAAGAAGFVIGLFTALILDRAGVAMRPMYLLAAAMAILAAASCLGIPRDIKTPGPRLVFRRKYSLFYGLCFLEGWRKQIFLCFSAFLLVDVYGTKLKTILILWLGVQVVGYFASPWVGRLIDRIGERKVLVFYFGCLTLFFLGYALIRSRNVLYGIFVVDNAFFIFHMALTTFVNKLAPKSEHTPTLSMGVAMNHVAAVTMPAIGGVLWKTLGYQWPFLIGAVAAAVSVGVSFLVPPHSASQRASAQLLRKSPL